MRYSLFNGDTGEIYHQSSSMDECLHIAFILKSIDEELNIWIM